MAAVVEDAALDTSTGSAAAPDVPADWKTGRAARAEAWFKSARDQASREFNERQQQCAEELLTARHAATNAAKDAQDIAAYQGLQQTTRSAAQQTLRSSLTKATQKNIDTANYQQLCFPQYTALRPIVLLSADVDTALFPQQLLARGIAATLLANAHIPPKDHSVSVRIDSCDELHMYGFGDLLQPGCGGTDLLWWDPLQQHVCCADKNLARLEVLQSCRICVLLLTHSLVAGPGWADECRVLAARVVEQQEVHTPLWLVVLRCADNELGGVVDFQLPALPDAVTTTTNITVVDIPYQALVEDQVMIAVNAIRQALPCINASLPEDIQPCFQPSRAVAAAIQEGRIYSPGSCIRNGLAKLDCEATLGPGVFAAQSRSFSRPSSALARGEESCLFTRNSNHTAASTQTLGAGLHVDVGDSWAVTHTLMATASDAAAACGRALDSKPLIEWTVTDVTLWLKSHGAAIAALAPDIQRYCLDGQLLACVQPQHLQCTLGLGNCPAYKLLVEAIQRLQSRHVIKDKHTRAKPAPVTTDSLHWLLTKSKEELEQVFMDVLRSYDEDCSNSLSLDELEQLLASCNISINTSQLEQLLSEYDTDADQQLAIPQEALPVMWDIWRVCVAARDCASWNVGGPVRNMMRSASAGSEGLHSVSTRGGSRRSRRASRSSMPSEHTPATKASPTVPHKLVKITSHATQFKAAAHPRDTRSTAAGSSVRQTALKHVPAARCLTSQKSARVSFAAGHFAKMIQADTPPARSVAATAAHPVRQAQKKNKHMGGMMQSPTHKAKLKLQGLTGLHARPTSDLTAGAGTERTGMGKSYMSIKAGHYKAHDDHNYDDEDSDNFDAVTVATDLDVFFKEPGMFAVTRLRGTSEPGLLAAGMTSCLAAADLRGSGTLPAAHVRAVLSGVMQAHGLDESPDTDDVLSQIGKAHGRGAAGLSPAEVRLVVERVLPALMAASGSQLDISQFVMAVIEAVTDRQQHLMQHVYGPEGMKQLLVSLHKQLYPDTLPGGGVDEKEELLGQFEDGPQLLELVIAHHSESLSLKSNVTEPTTNTGDQLGSNSQVPLLVRTAALQEAVSAAEQRAASGTAVVVWAAAASHILYVWSHLRNSPSGMAVSRSFNHDGQCE